MSTSAHDVAEFFLRKAEPAEAGDGISNLKLQKLLYYGQGFHLAVFDEPLFDEDLVAWAHGPVVAQMYHQYKSNGANRIDFDADFEPEISQSAAELLDDVYNVYGQYSAWTLRNLTHAELPWLRAQDAAGVISHKDLRTYFKTQLVD